MTDPQIAIHSFLVQVGTRIGEAHTADAQDWLDHGEWGLAIDAIAEGLFEAEMTLDAHERQAFLALVQSIGRSIDGFAFLGLGG